jgi:hypothetical protein
LQACAAKGLAVTAATIMTSNAAAASADSGRSDPGNQAVPGHFRLDPFIPH